MLHDAGIWVGTAAATKPACARCEGGVMVVLPADTHVQGEFLWGTDGPTSPSAALAMKRTCPSHRIGLPVIWLFTVQGVVGV